MVTSAVLPGHISEQIGRSLLIDDDADEHLVQVRPTILRVTAFTERGAPSK